MNLLACGRPFANLPPGGPGVEPLGKGRSQDLPDGMLCRIYYPDMDGELTPLDVCPGSST